MFISLFCDHLFLLPGGEKIRPFVAEGYIFCALKTITRNYHKEQNYNRICCSWNIGGKHFVADIDEDSEWLFRTLLSSRATRRTWDWYPRRYWHQIKQIFTIANPWPDLVSECSLIFELLSDHWSLQCLTRSIAAHWQAMEHRNSVERGRHQTVFLLICEDVRATTDLGEIKDHFKISAPN